jgi:dihydroorotate dehydrogenase
MLASLYPFARPLLFGMDPELAHDRMLDLLAKTQHSWARQLYSQPRIDDPVTLAGLTFPNRVGLAAGLDKNARCIDGLSQLGFGFVEVGTVTPKGQPGNPKPRMFRLPEVDGIINRLGFNNEGLDAFLKNVQLARFRQGQSRPMLLGLNIGKNATTPIERAADDYLACLEGVYPHADYVTVNISSPNTQNLRALQSDQALDDLLQALGERRIQLQAQHRRRVPMFIKIAPDLDEQQVALIAGSLRRHGMQGDRSKDEAWGVIATNTTIARDQVSGLPHGNETGGLSGAPVFAKSNEVIRQLRQHLGPHFPIIGVGGILSGADALGKVQAGADVVQVYSGLIYRGPALVTECARTLREALR